MASYDSRFAQLAALKLDAAIAEATEALASGTQVVREDAAATGMNCVRYIGHIAGLRAAVRILEVVQDEMSGKPKQQPQRDEN